MPIFIFCELSDIFCFTAYYLKPSQDYRVKRLQFQDTIVDEISEFNLAIVSPITVKDVVSLIAGSVLEPIFDGVALTELILFVTLLFVLGIIFETETSDGKRPSTTFNGGRNYSCTLRFYPL